MKKIIPLYILIAALAGAGIYQYMNKPKIAYVQLEKVYNSFDLKKQLEKKLETVLNSRKNILDSMEIRLKSSGAVIDGMTQNNKERSARIEQFGLLQQDYLMKKKLFDEDNQRTVQNYDQQTWEQINQFVKDYGKEKNYDFIIGGNGSGNLMFAKEAFDITEEVTAYLNERNKGKGL